MNHLILDPIDVQNSVSVLHVIMYVHYCTPMHAETVIRVNDTVIGDPLFTVPLRVTNLGELGLGGSISLCYEVHGDADK